jgi:hypothetical protein
MATSLYRGAIVGQDRTLELHVPELAPGQRVRVIIEPETSTKPRYAIDVLNGLAGQRLFKTAEEVESYLQAEREAWGR